MPPALWIAVARAGTLLALALAFRLAEPPRRRRPGRRARRRWSPRCALFLTPDWFQFAAHGQRGAAGGGADAVGDRAAPRRAPRPRARARHAGLPDAPRAVRLPGASTALWAWRARAAAAAAAGAARWCCCRSAWIGPRVDRLGHARSTAAAQARSEPAWSLSLRSVPGCARCERVHNHVGPGRGAARRRGGRRGALARRRRAVAALAARGARGGGAVRGDDAGRVQRQPALRAARPDALVRCSPASARPTWRSSCRPRSGRAGAWRSSAAPAAALALVGAPASSTRARPRARRRGRRGGQAHAGAPRPGPGRARGRGPGGGRGDRDADRQPRPAHRGSPGSWGCRWSWSRASPTTA